MSVDELHYPPARSKQDTPPVEAVVAEGVRPPRLEKPRRDSRADPVFRPLRRLATKSGRPDFRPAVVGACYFLGVPLRRADVEAYLNRGWASLSEDADENRAAAYRRDPEWSFRTATALRDEVARRNPAWPTAADRAADLAHHRALIAALDRVSHALELRRRVS